MGGLYIHVAYCRRKCIYCDFFSAGERIADWHRYVEALCCELNDRIIEIAYPFRTVYIGGGTPSLIPAEEFERLCDNIKPFIGNSEEFTLEANPDDVNERMLQVWKDGGVNRLSIGIQSFDDNVLSSLGRMHDASASRRAYEMARKYFDNISIDLIFGLPGQTLEMWKKDLREVVSMRPEHISAYSLMYEDSTVLTVMRDNGILTETDDEITEKMFLVLIEELRKAGYEHYETSNFALPGYRSRHNSSYWLQIPYLGLGPSAHSYDGRRTRKSNKADLRGFLDYWTPASYERSSLCRDDIMVKEFLSDDELKEEYVLTRMRMCEGIDLNDYKKRFGEKEYCSLISKSIKWIKKGSLIINDSHLAVAEHSILISDSIILDLA